MSGKPRNSQAKQKKDEALAKSLLDEVAGLKDEIQKGEAQQRELEEALKQALQKVHLDISYVPPRYRSSYFLHIWANGYEAGYYAYLWTEMLDDAAFQWFQDHGGMTRANGDRFRKMVLSRGNTEDLDKMYSTWLGSQPTIQPMLKDRGLTN